MKSGLELENRRDGDVSLAVIRPDYHTDIAPVVHMVAVDVGVGFDKFCEVCIFVITLGNECATEFAIFKSVWSTYLKEELRFPNLIAASRSRLAVSRSSLLFCSLTERFSLMAAITAVSACVSAEVEPPPPPQAVSRDKARTPTRRRAASFFRCFIVNASCRFQNFCCHFWGAGMIIGTSRSGAFLALLYRTAWDSVNCEIV